MVWNLVILAEQFVGQQGTAAILLFSPYLEGDGVRF